MRWRTGQILLQERHDIVVYYTVLYCYVLHAGVLSLGDLDSSPDSGGALEDALNTAVAAMGDETQDGLDVSEEADEQLLGDDGGASTLVAGGQW